MPAATNRMSLLGTVSQIDGGHDGDRHAGTTGAATVVISVIDKTQSGNATKEKEKES